jgi:hypothetical protein
MCAQDAERVLPELPARAGGYCLSGGSDIVRYGDAGGNLRTACGELFNGECELYRSYGLLGVTVARYGDESHGERFVNATLTEFDKTKGALGFFQRRALGDAHPEAATVRPLVLPEGQGRAMIGAGVLYVWRGRRVLELAYLSEDETPDEMRKTSDLLLPNFALAAAERMGGSALLPFEVAFFEEEAPLLGVRLFTDQLLELPGTGPGAEAFFSGPMGHHRVVLAIRPDEAGAKDLFRSFRFGLGGLPSTKKVQHTQMRRLRAGHEPEVWMLGREGRAVVLVGPDERHPSEYQEERAQARLLEILARLRRSSLPAN